MKQLSATHWRPDHRWTVAVAWVLLLMTVGSCSSGPTVRIADPTTSATPAPDSTPATAAVPAPTSTSTTVVSTTRIEGDLTAGQVAAELTAVEQAAGRGDGSVGVRQQLLYRYLASHSDLDAAVLTALPEDVRPFVERIVQAREFGQARAAANPAPAAPSATLPAWTVTDPAPVDELLADYRAAETATGIAWYWLAAIHLQETRMGRIIGVSSAGAVGPMQFLPETWARCCTGDPTVTRDAIVGAATYLAQSGGPGDMAAALHVYNPNDSYVATVTAFAENLRDNPQLYAAYHAWQVFFSTAAGTIRLPVGYSETQPIDAATYLVDHPADAAG